MPTKSLGWLLVLSMHVAACYKTRLQPVDEVSSDNAANGTERQQETDIEGGGAVPTDTNVDVRREGVAEVLLLDDFEDGDDINLLNGSWATHHVYPDKDLENPWSDGPLLPESPGYGGSRYAMHIVGDTLNGHESLNFSTSLHPDGNCPLCTAPDVDLSAYDGIQFMAKGTPFEGPFYMVFRKMKTGPDGNCLDGFIPVTLTEGLGHQYDFGEDVTSSWRLHRIRFDEIEQHTSQASASPLDFTDVLSHLLSFSWEYRRSDEFLDFWLDDLALFKDHPLRFPLTVVSPDAAFELWDNPEDPAVATVTKSEVSGQSFTSSTEVSVDQEPQMIWDVKLITTNETRIRPGDLLHAHLYARCVVPPVGEDHCRIKVEFQGKNRPWGSLKSHFLWPPVPSGSLAATVGPEWQRVAFDFESRDFYGVGNGSAVINFGYPGQTVAIGGFTVTNYGDTVEAGTLERSMTTYDGRAADDPWRRAAAERIETHRQGHLAIVVQQQDGTPVVDGTIDVQMLRHAFGFGTVVDADKVLHDVSEKIPSLFNTVVMRNTLNWPALAGDLGPELGFDRADEALDWAAAKGLKVRGQELLKPSWEHLPAQLKYDRDQRAQAEGRDAAQAWLEETVASHVQSTANAFAGRLAHWDVINGPFENNDLMDLLGTNAMTDWLDLARNADGTAQLFISDNNLIAPVSTNSASLKHLSDIVTSLINNGAPFDGIGIQGAFDTDLTSPQEIYARLESLAPLGKVLWITGFDMPMEELKDPSLVADYLRDVLTIFFSHPSAGGFIMERFQDAAEGPLGFIYDIDGIEKPSGSVYREIVHNQWLTTASGVTDQTGRYTTSGFYGDYLIEVAADGKTVSKEISHVQNTGEILVVFE